MAGNILFGGLIGAAVDAGSGATKELKPNPLNVRLVPNDPGATRVEVAGRVEVRP